jgi:hypothetical protein
VLVCVRGRVRALAFVRACVGACMCGRVRAWVRSCVRAWARGRVGSCVCGAHTCVCGCVRACVRGRVRASVRSCVRACVRAWARMCVGAHIKTFIHHSTRLLMPLPTPRCATRNVQRQGQEQANFTRRDQPRVEAVQLPAPRFRFAVAS